MNFEWKFFGSSYLDFLVLGLKVMIYHDQLKLLQISSRTPLLYYCYNNYTFVKTVDEFKSTLNSCSVKIKCWIYYSFLYRLRKVVLYLGLFISIKLQKSKYSCVILKIEFTSTKKVFFHWKQDQNEKCWLIPQGWNWNWVARS